MKHYLGKTPIQIAGYLMIFISLFLPVDGLHVGVECLAMVLLFSFHVLASPDSILANNCFVLVLLGLAACISVAFLYEESYSRLRYYLALGALPLSWFSIILVDEPRFGLWAYLTGILLVFIAELADKTKENKKETQLID